MFKNYRAYALAEKIRAVYNDPRVQEESVSYVFQTTPAAEPEELMKLVNWGLKLNGSPLSVVFGAALEIDSKAAFRDSYQELYEEAKDMDAVHLLLEAEWQAREVQEFLLSRMVHSQTYWRASH